MLLESTWYLCLSIAGACAYSVFEVKYREFPKNQVSNSYDTNKFNIKNYYKIVIFILDYYSLKVYFEF